MAWIGSTSRHIRREGGTTLSTPQYACLGFGWRCRSCAGAPRRFEQGRRAPTREVGPSSGTERDGAVERLGGHREQRAAGTPGIPTHHREGLFRLDPQAFGKRALGLLDDDAAVQGALELF